MRSVWLVVIWCAAGASALIAAPLRIEVVALDRNGIPAANMQAVAWLGPYAEMIRAENLTDRDGRVTIEVDAPMRPFMGMLHVAPGMLPNEPMGDAVERWRLEKPDRWFVRPYWFRAERGQDSVALRVVAEGTASIVGRPRTTDPANRISLLAPIGPLPHARIELASGEAFEIAVARSRPRIEIYASPNREWNWVRSPVMQPGERQLDLGEFTVDAPEGKVVGRAFRGEALSGQSGFFLFREDGAVMAYIDVHGDGVIDNDSNDLQEDPADALVGASLPEGSYFVLPEAGENVQSGWEIAMEILARGRELPEFAGLERIRVVAGETREIRIDLQRAEEAERAMVVRLWNEATPTQPRLQGG